MPDFAIADPHLHVWDPGRLRYPWLEAVPALNRSFTLADYDEALGPVRVERAVFVQCECDPAQYQEEVQWVTELAELDGRIGGIVAWAPLEKGEAARDELRLLARNPLVKGIRRIIQFEPDLEFCLRPEFVRGVQMVEGFGWAFDLCIDWRHTANTIRLVEQCPGVRFVVDHIGKPDIRGRRLEPWRGEMERLAAFENVHCKVSSLATEADHANWTVDDLRPYVDHIFACFGYERTMFAGDWPVSSQAASYPVCVETLEALVPNASRGELARLFRENAMEFYGLG